jgi:Family of unknown function (DUF6212)/Domain of unknown function (DUF4214)
LCNIFNLNYEIRDGLVIEGYVDQVDATGLVYGWARNRHSAQPCIVEIRQNGKIVAETVADEFRVDLLDAGLGHGHYGYVAQLRGAVASDSALELYLAGTEHRLNPDDNRTWSILSETARPVVTVEALLAARRRWSAEDISRNLSALQLDRNLEEMGPARFLDVTYKYLLGRWSDQAGYQAYQQALTHRTLSAEAFFRTMLESEEYKQSGHGLGGPYDSTFPFRLLPAELPEVAEADASTMGNDGTVEEALSAAVPLVLALDQVAMVSEPWQGEQQPVRHDPNQNGVFCHPPVSGIALGRLSAVLGPCRLQARLHIGNELSAAVDFAVAFAPSGMADEAVNAALMTGQTDAQSLTFSGWQTVRPGGDRPIELLSPPSTGSYNIYFATRMGADSDHNHYAWAVFADIVCLA